MSEGTTKASDAAKVSAKEMLKELGASAGGLSDREAEKRLEGYGFNAIEEQHVSPTLKFLSYFWGPIPWMIEAAALLSAVVKDWADQSALTGESLPVEKQTGEEAYSGSIVRRGEMDEVVTGTGMNSFSLMGSNDTSYK